jgi:hypothetical protein
MLKASAECRRYHGVPALVASSKGFDAYKKKIEPDNLEF